MQKRIIEIIRREVNNLLSRSEDLSEREKPIVLDKVIKSVTRILGDYATPDNRPAFTSLLDGVWSGSQFGASEMLQDMQDKLVSDLTKNSDLKQEIAENIAVNIVPTVFAAISDEVDDKVSGMNLDEVVDELTER